MPNTKYDFLKKINFQFIHKEFRNFDLDLDISFNFNEVDGYINICFDAITCRKGWSVLPHQEVPTRVSMYYFDFILNK